MEYFHQSKTLFFDNYEEIKIPIKIERRKIVGTIWNKLRNRIKDYKFGNTMIQKTKNKIIDKFNNLKFFVIYANHYCYKSNVIFLTIVL